jgi:hypothetical protein
MVPAGYPGFPQSGIARVGMNRDRARGLGRSQGIRRGPGSGKDFGRRRGRGGAVSKNLWIKH